MKVSKSNRPSRALYLLLALVVGEIAWGRLVAFAAKDALDIVYDHPKVEEEAEPNHQTAISVEVLFKNSFFSSGIASGTEALNHSLESLMHSIFYGLMDNEFRVPSGKFTVFGVNLARDVYSTRQGPFVVVDKMAAGPRYAHELYKVQDIPVVASADVNVDALDIYLRTDADRISEKDSLPPWRVLVNNWFGLVPLLSAILPPSFDPNEMYDPLKRIEAPFRTPLSVASFYRMPIHGIRSYGLTGGIGISADLQGVVASGVQKTFERLKILNLNFPIGVFKRGEFRINVLRKSEHTAWIAVSNVDRQGMNARAFAGNTIYLLAKAVPFYKGIPAVFAPIDIQGEVDWTDRTDRVYEFDMRSPTAQSAYEGAVRGDLTLADVAGARVEAKAPSTGVLFHFKKRIKQQSESSLNNRNLLVMRDVVNQQRSQAEVAITDNDGTYHLLEARQDSASQHWDILVGPEDRSVKLDAKIKVKRIDEPAVQGGDGYRFEFHDSPSPMRVSLYLDIEDRYTTVSELQVYLERLSRFSGLEMSGLQDLPRKDPDEMAAHRRIVYFDHPDDSPLRANARALYVGRFAASAAIVLDSASLDRITSSSLDSQWRALAGAYGRPVDEWGTPQKRVGLDWDLEWAKSALAYLLRIGNFRSSVFDAIHESDKAVRAIASLAEGKTPLEKRKALYGLFDSDHPDRLARALADLAGMDRIPRRVKLFAQSKGDAPERVRRAFETYDGRVFRSSVRFPKDEQFSRVDQELEQFQPQSIRPQSRQLAITSIKLFNPLQHDGSKVLMARIKCDDLSPTKGARIYVKLVQDGKLQLTNLSLVERVVTIKPSGGALDLILSGPKGLFAGQAYDRLLGFGGPMAITFAVAPNGDQWTDRKVIKFRYDNSDLTPQ